MENTNIAPKSVKDLKYAFMAGKNITAKIAEGPKYALMTGKSKHAKSAKEVKYASMTGKSKHAKSAEGPKSAFITGKRKPAKSAKDPKSALMTGESEPVRSAVTRLKLASNNGLLVDGNTIRSAIFMTQTDLSTSAFLKASLKTTNNVITEIVKTQSGKAQSTSNIQNIKMILRQSRDLIIRLGISRATVFCAA